ncbi:MAG: single-stranded DNA-binding protein [Candidatus Pacebacteria bacterium]|nr:single-stranded DNA-binding protein [Candidatus Paceibacterota bacterium]
MITYINSNAVVFLDGYLGQNPIISKHKKCVVLKLATHEYRVTDDVEQRTKTVWHTVYVWNEEEKEQCLKFAKGDRLSLTAMLRYEVMQDAKGNTINGAKLHLYNGEGAYLKLLK